MSLAASEEVGPFSWLGLSAESLVFVLIAYFDESGTHKNSRAVCLGGYLSTKQKWSVFEIQWQSMLAEVGILILHRGDLEGFKREFAGWSNAERKKLLHKAHRIIRALTLKGYYGAVVKADFDQVVPGYIKRTLGGSYGWLVQDALAGLATWRTDRKITESVHLVFELGAQGAGQAQKMLDAFRITLPLRG